MLAKMAKLRKPLQVVLVAAALGLPLNSLAAPSATVADPMIMGKAALTQNDYVKAVQIYEAASKTDEYKNSCECRLGLGKSLCRLADTQKAGKKDDTYRRAAKELRKAVRVGKGSANAREANKLMCQLPQHIIAPKTGPGTALIALLHGLRGRDRGTGEAKPKVLEFAATWCEPCKQMQKVIEKAKSEYGDQVEFIHYDIDDPKSEKVIDDYEVSPIPTLIFLDKNNEVVTYSIGYSGENGLKTGMKKILPAG